MSSWTVAFSRMLRGVRSIRAAKWYFAVFVRALTGSEFVLARAEAGQAPDVYCIPGACRPQIFRELVVIVEYDSCRSC